MDKRKLLALIGLIVVTIGLAIGIYFVFFRGTPEPTPTDVTTPGGGGQLLGADGERIPGTGVTSTPDGGPQGIGTEPGGASPIADGGITRVRQLVPSGTANITVEGNSGTVQYYDTDTGLFHKILADGTNIVLNDEAPFPNAKDVNWSNATDKAIIEFPDGANVLYNFDTKQQVTLPSHWAEFEFSPNDSQIAAKKLSIDPSSRYLVIASPDGTSAKNVVALGQNANKVQVSWSPNDQMIAFSQTGRAIGLGREQVLVVGKNNENFKALTVEGLGFKPKWSPQGDILLYSSFRQANNLAPELWVVRGTADRLGEDRQPLGLSTWVEKCTFASNTTLYCAVPDPDRLPYGIGFQLALATNTDDSIYKVDLETGRTTLIGKPEGSFTIDSIRVAPDESAVYFTDRITGSLQQMQLQ